MACQANDPPPPVKASEASEFEELSRAEDIHPICTPTGHVRLEESLLAFEMDCVDHKDPTLKMLGVVKRYPEALEGWYEGPFSNAAFLPMPADHLLVYYKVGDAEDFILLSPKAGEWTHSLAEVPGRLEPRE